MSPAPLFWITVLCLLSGLLGLSVSGWRHGKAVQQIVLGSAGLLGVLLSLTFFLAPLGLPMAACAPVTYVACRLVAGLGGACAHAARGTDRHASAAVALYSPDPPEDILPARRRCRTRGLRDHRARRPAAGP